MIPPITPILDIGTGTGILSSHLRQTIIGLDLSFDMLLTGLMKGRNFIPLAASASNLPFRRHALQNIISLTVLHNVTDPQSALNEIKRVGNTGSLAIVTLLKKSQKTQMIQKWIREKFDLIDSFEVPPEDIGQLFRI
jgi:ubiquinone/menaquinone biosynthesis C-methylase UbiE